MVTKILLIFNTIKSIPDLIKQIPSVADSIKKIWRIIKGWFYKLFKKKQDIANPRLKICNTCEHNVETSLGNACAQCGCILDAKTRVEDEHCDLDKW
jgi:hypothetical protein